MLKAFEELEKAVEKLLEHRKDEGSSSGVSGSPETPQVDNEEAAELIRRAIKRLKAL